MKCTVTTSGEESDLVSIPLVTLILDLFDGSETPISQGLATLTPSEQLTDVTDQQIITQSPVNITFSSTSQAVAVIMATDAPGPQPSGWQWQISFSGVGGSPASLSVYVPAGPASFTADNASPCVFTWTPPGSNPWNLQALPDGTGLQLSGSSLPGGFTTDTTYYVVNSSTDTFELAATPGGTALGSTSTGSGNLIVVQYNLSAIAG